MRCVGADIRTHEVVAGHLGSGRAAAAGVEVGAGVWLVFFPGTLEQGITQTQL
jgi:hypothetical protein